MNEWLGERATQVLYRPTPGTTTGHYDAIVEICSFAGNWHFNDWTDPPRLLGQITAPGMGFQGTFDAVFCDSFYGESWPD